jgi:Tfp pilus assembly protein PilX
MRTSSERGVAMIAALLVLMLMTALTVGFTAVIMSDQRNRGIDRDRTQAFYGAQAGLEKMTSDLGTLFFANLAPTGAQVQALADNPPVIGGVSFTKSDGTSGYEIQQGAAQSRDIQSGPYAGLKALATDYTIDVTGRTTTGGEVHLKRTIQTVAIPVFQFGMFSDVDLSFFAGANFDFGGRVHTNGNLFLASSATLNLSDKITAVKEIVRPYLSNGASIDTSPAHNGTVNVLRSPGVYRALAPTEGSVVGMPGSALNDPTWTNLSIGTYNAEIRNGRTGAKALNLPLLTVGGSNPDLVKRPPTANEDTANPTLFEERYFSKVSLRILLSDTAADITNLPTVTADAPKSLEPAAYNAAGIDATHPPVAQSGGTNHVTDLSAIASTTVRVATNAGDTVVKVNSLNGFPVPTTFTLNGNLVSCTGTSTGGGSGTRFTGCSNVPAAAVNTAVSYAFNTGYLSSAGTGTIGGFIKIEMQDTGKVWHDVTNEILAYGIAGKNLLVGGCAEPNANAIIRLERVRDNLNACGIGSTTATDYMPMSLFDPREGLVRDTSPGANVELGGVMYYVELDVANLSNWFKGAGAYAGGSGPNALTDNGYAVYFSDRRNNRNASNQETGEYGWEDTINPASSSGATNFTLDSGEDVNANGQLDTYGRYPSYNGVYNTVPPGGTTPLGTGARPDTLITQAQAQNNRPLLFRRALKLVNGGLGNIVTPGLTVVAENPVYVQGDYNANQAGFGDPHASAAIIADAVTILSNNWNDDESYTAPYSPGTRGRSAQSYYRFAVIAGKNPSFSRPTAWASATDFGTDGGAHNFLRMLEGNGQTVNYRGSIATFYYSRQATGVYKCCTTVYDAPTRRFAFDTDFLDPTKLPPMTPAFRDLNTTTFSQELRPLK